MELNDKSNLCRHLHDFVSDLQLTFVDDMLSSVDRYSYRVVTTGSSSMIDHFAVSRKLYQQVQDVKIDDCCINLYEHCPLILEVCVSLSCSTVPTRYQSHGSDVVSF